MAHHEVEYAASSPLLKKVVGISQPFNQEDNDDLQSSIAGTDVALNQFIDDEMRSASFRCKAQLELVWKVKDAVRNIPIYINSAANNGKTRILHGSTYDSNYGTLNATLNVTD